MPLILVNNLDIFEKLLNCGLTHMSNYQPHNVAEATDEASKILGQIGVTLTTDREEEAVKEALNKRNNIGD